MTSLSWLEIVSSILEIQVLMVLSRSFETTWALSINRVRNSSINDRPRSFSSSVPARNPTLIISSSRVTSCCSAVRTSSVLLFCSGSGIRFLLDLALRGGFRLRLFEAARHDQLLPQLGVFQDFDQLLFQLVVAVHLREQVRQPLAGFDQPAQRLDLIDYVVGMKIIQLVEFQFDVELAAVVGDLVVHAIGQARFHSGHDLVEIVAVNLDELSILELGQRLLLLARIIADDAHQERQLFHLDCVTDLNLVSDLNSRRPHPTQFLLCTWRLRHLSFSLFHSAPALMPSSSLTFSSESRFLMISGSSSSSGNCAHFIARRTSRGTGLCGSRS